MEVAVAVEFEAVCETSSGHFEDRVFDGLEFLLHLGVVFGSVIECTEDLDGLCVSSFQDKPVVYVSVVARRRRRSYCQQFTHHLGDSGSPGIRATMNRARMIWKAIATNHISASTLLVDDISCTYESAMI